jgi:hypothetical protein
LTSANIDAHLAIGRTKLADWVAANPELDTQIVAAARKSEVAQPPIRGHLLVEP